jgi:transcriptional regulator with XRE-family HTH domain
MLSLGENLARLRTARGLTQDHLAQLSGVSVDLPAYLHRSGRVCSHWVARWSGTKSSTADAGPSASPSQPRTTGKPDPLC